MNVLFVIPARGGSKGIPGKNIKLLAGKPLIGYSIAVARALAKDEDICVSTDDIGIMNTVEAVYGLSVPFRRPPDLATDSAGTNEVLLHALSYYESVGRHYECLVLLQPTSPLRTVADVQGALDVYRPTCDMVVGVKKSHSAAVLCRENERGLLEMCLNRVGAGRQSFSDFYEINGAVYVINTTSLCEKGLSGLEKKVKYLMPSTSSVDIDDMNDWMYAEFLLSSRSIGGEE